MASYDEQDRGSESAYDRYLRGMDASMRQKVALTAAHLLCEGELADMGMGSGSGSFAIASLYPDLTVIGVDIDPEMVRRATERYDLPNLRFVEGDIAARCFAPNSLEAILDSSVLHHVTSYNGYDRSRATDAMAIQAEQLAEGGILIVRDFLDPGEGLVWLDVRCDDGDDSDDPERCSTARLLERFAREFRRLAAPDDRGFQLERVGEIEASMPPLAEGFGRYRLSKTMATELVLRKDYRSSWNVEVQEEYCFATQAEMEDVFGKLGLRVLASTPIRNPWIVHHRFVGQIALWDETGARLDWPATNYVIVGQKVSPSEGVEIVATTTVPPIGYVEVAAYERVDTGKVYDVARRPGMVVDVLPWFERDGSIHVLARRSYPRPVLAVQPQPAVDGATPVAYVTEPLNVEQRAFPIGQTVEDMLVGLEGLHRDGIEGLEVGPEYYPSPGGIQEQVRSMFVRVSPTNVHTPLENLSGFSTSGVIRAIEARQLLRAAQVGALPDARLELNVYELLLRGGHPLGAWIGEAFDDLPDLDELAVTNVQTLANRPRRRRFRPADAPAGFLEVRAYELEERNTAGEVVARGIRELVLPKHYGINTVSVAPLCRHRGRAHLGIHDDDLPASQCFDGHSELLVLPAWRLPAPIDGTKASRDFVAERLATEHGLRIGRVAELGGRYHPSSGLTPELVFPLAVQVSAVDDAPQPLAWVPLDELVTDRRLLLDGHLRVGALRAAHALGIV